MVESSLEERLHSTSGIQSILHCGQHPWDELESLCQTANIKLVHCPPKDILCLSENFDLVMLFDCLEHYSVPQGRILIGRMRHLTTTQIWAITRDQSRWQLTDFIGMGFVSAGRLSRSGAQVHTYHLDNYIRKRSWNNPKFWANPENWNKYRW